MHRYDQKTRTTTTPETTTTTGLLLPKMLRTREKWYVTDAGIINMLNLTFKDN